MPLNLMEYLIALRMFSLPTLLPTMTPLVAHVVKHLTTMQETQVWSLGWEDPLEKEMATHSSTLAWKIPWTEEPGRLQSMMSQRVGHDWVTLLTQCRRGFPCSSVVKNRPAMQETWVQFLDQEDPLRREWQPTLVFCLENFMDRGALWATVPGVAKSQTQLSDFH